MSSSPDNISDKYDANETVKQKITFFVYFVAVIASFGGLLFGFDIGGSGGTFVMSGFRAEFDWRAQDCPYAESSSLCDDYEPNGDKEKQEQALITSLFSISAMIGALASSYIADFLGRRLSLMLNSTIFTLACGIQAYSPKIWVLYIGRLFAGYAIGQLSSVVTMYQSEIAPDHIRGLLVSFQQLSITLGILIAAACNIGFREFDWGWRLSYGGNGIFSITMFIAMVFMPESPRYLVMKGHVDEAREVLLRIRGSEVENELQHIVVDVDKERAIGDGSWKEVFSNENSMLYRTCLGCGLQFLQQFCGINAIMFFAPSIIGSFFSDNVALLGNLGIQAGNFLATFICLYLIDRSGRVTLLVVGGIGMLIGTLTVALLSSPAFDYKKDETVGIFIIIFCVFYVVHFSYSWGPIVWVLCSEIYPNRLRAKAMSLSTATNWSCAAIIGYITPYMYDKSALDLYGTFLFFSFWIVVLTLVSYFMVPETSNLSLEEVDALFEDFKPKLTRKLHFSLTPSKEGSNKKDSINNSAANMWNDKNA